MDLDLGTPIWERSIQYLLVYFAPVMIGAWRRFRDRDASSPVWILFLIVFFTGWTVIGWLWALRLAFRDKSIDWLTMPASGSASGPPSSGGGLSMSSWQPTETSCSPCGGSGRVSCNGCGGQARWDSSASSCSACAGSGQVNCFSCLGSGKTRG